MSLERESPIALYRQIAADLAAALVTDYQLGQRLPSENALMAQYAVSRITIRQALAELAMRGLVVRQQGKGTFVAAPQGPQNPYPLTGLGDLLTAQGLTPETTLLFFGPRRPAPPICERLQLVHDEALAFQRLYRVAGLPIALTEVYYPPEVGIMITEAAAAAHSSQALLTEHAGVILGHAELHIRATVLTPTIATLLALSPTVPVLIEERVTYCTAGIPREHSTLYLRPDCCELQLTIQPGQSLARAVQLPLSV